MNKIIHCRVRLCCDAQRAFEMFTVKEHLESWLTTLAAVEPVPGGKYELFRDVDDRDHNSTSGCRVTALEPGRFLSFEWKGPVEFERLMNSADPLTHVVVFFIPCDGESP